MGGALSCDTPPAPPQAGGNAPHADAGGEIATVTWRVDVDLGKSGAMCLRRGVEGEAREAFDDFCASDLGGHVQLFRVVAGVDELIAAAFVSAPVAEAV